MDKFKAIHNFEIEASSIERNVYKGLDTNTYEIFLHTHVANIILRTADKLHTGSHLFIKPGKNGNKRNKGGLRTNLLLAVVYLVATASGSW